jgi:hypothetical protein
MLLLTTAVPDNFLCYAINRKDPPISSPHIFLTVSEHNVYQNNQKEREKVERGYCILLE